MKTYHDVIPISCLTEFPNVVQMAKVGGAVPTGQGLISYGRVTTF